VFTLACHYKLLSKTGSIYFRLEYTRKPYTTIAKPSARLLSPEKHSESAKTVIDGLTNLYRRSCSHRLSSACLPYPQTHTDLHSNAHQYSSYPHWSSIARRSVKVLVLFTARNGRVFGVAWNCGRCEDVEHSRSIAGREEEA
jgi:hypothetical protein